MMRLLWRLRPKSATVAIDRRPCPRYTDCGHNSPCPQSRHLPLDGQGFRRPRLRFRRPCRLCPESYLSPPSPRAWARSLKRSLSPTLQSAQHKVRKSKEKESQNQNLLFFFCFPQFPHFGLLLSPFSSLFLEATLDKGGRETGGRGRLGRRRRRGQGSDSDSLQQVPAVRAAASCPRWPVLGLQGKAGEYDCLRQGVDREQARTGLDRVMGTRRGGGGAAQVLASARPGVPGVGSVMDSVNDDLVLVILDFVDVKQVLSTVARSSRRLRSVAREWMPWRCLDVRFWVSIPKYQSKLGEIYTQALDKCKDECSSDEVHARHLQVSVFLGQAGLYKDSEAILNKALATEEDENRQADLLHALADVLWKAQQARQGGGKDFLHKVVTAAGKSITLRRRMAQNETQRRKLALTLEIFAENSACYGHYVQAMVFQETGMDWVEYKQHIDHTLRVAEEAAVECIQLWADMGNHAGKLADAWAAYAAVDFYAGRHYERAMAKLRVARSISTKAQGLLHPTLALILFNMGYITHLVFRKPKAAAELFSKSLLIREKVLGQEHPFTVATKAELDRCARMQPRVPAGAMSAAGGAGTGVAAGVITAATADGQEAAAGMDTVQMDAAMSDAVHDPVDVD